MQPHDTTETAPAKPFPLHPQGFSRIRQTAEIMGIHPQTLRRWWKADKFPEPLDIHGVKLFRNADVLAWLDEQTAVDDAPTTDNSEV